MTSRGPVTYGDTGAFRSPVVTPRIAVPDRPRAPESNLFRDPHVAASVRGLRATAGDASSVFSIAAAAAVLAPRPVANRLGGPLVTASLLAGAADTAFNFGNWVSGDRHASAASTAYAATGLLPASSLAWAHYLHGKPTGTEIGRIVALGANVALIGYEADRRGERIVAGTEDASGYLALGAALSGVVMRSR